MPTNHPHIAGRVLNQPILLEPGYASVFFSALSSRLGITQLTAIDGAVSLGEKMQLDAASFTRTRDSDSEPRPYQVIDGVAVLPISGTLVHKHGYLQPYSGMTGYDGILARGQMAANDPEVKGALLVMTTPGGEVAGCFDAARSLRKMFAGVKPLWALADDMFCSAGMAIASAAERRLTTQTAVIGSVGVVMAHASHEEQLEKEGIKVTLIHSGAAKVAGNPYQDLSKTDLADFQSNTDTLRTEFAQLVAEHCGLKVDAVLATEAATYRGQAAIDIGFADELINANDAVAHFAAYLNDQTNQNETGHAMSKQTLTAPGAEQTTTTPQAGPVDEKARISGILQSDEAKGRESLANHLAFKTEMSVEDVIATLAAAPISAESGLGLETALDGVMSKETNPVIGDDAETGASNDESVGILASYKVAINQA